MPSRLTACNVQISNCSSFGVLAQGGGSFVMEVRMLTAAATAVTLRITPSAIIAATILTCETSGSLYVRCSPARCCAARWQVPRRKIHLRVMACSCIQLCVIRTCMDELNCCRRLRNRFRQRGQVRCCCASLGCYTC